MTHSPLYYVAKAAMLNDGVRIIIERLEQWEFEDYPDKDRAITQALRGLLWRATAYAEREHGDHRTAPFEPLVQLGHIPPFVKL